MGCSSTVKTPAYKPLQSFTYVNKIAHKVAIGKIDDKRSEEPKVFFINGIDPFKSNFDKPITDVVREALGIELVSFGKTVVEGNGTDVDLVLKCDILQFSCTETSAGFSKKHQLLFIVEIVFQWQNPATRKIVLENTRIIHHKTPSKFPHGFDFSTNFMHEELLTDYGKMLVTVALPAVIREELGKFSLPIGQ